MVEIWFNKCMENYSNKGEKMKKEIIEMQTSQKRSELWSIVHEVSKEQPNLARKLDEIFSDLQELNFRKGMEVGEEITKMSKSELKASSSSIMEEINAIKNLLGDK